MMSREMGATKAKFIVISVIWTILVLESATMSSVQEEKDPFCDAFCKSFEGLYQDCMTVCPSTKSIPKMMAIEGTNSIANVDLKAKCNGVCSSYTELDAHKTCISGCLRSMRMDNDAVCETSCSIVQEEPLVIRCMRVCHERIPGVVDSSLE